MPYCPPSITTMFQVVCVSPSVGEAEIGARVEAEDGQEAKPFRPYDLETMASTTEGFDRWDLDPTTDVYDVRRLLERLRKPTHPRVRTKHLEE
jgi:hypothetical protein